MSNSARRPIRSLPQFAVVPSDQYSVVLSNLSLTGMLPARLNLSGPPAGPSLAISPTLAALNLSPVSRALDVPPGTLVTVTYSLGNTGTQPLLLTLNAQSAQNNPLTLSHASLTLAAGAVQPVTVTVALSPALPVGVGDCVLLEADMGDVPAVVGISTIATSCYDLDGSGMVDVLDITGVASRWHDPAQYDPAYDVSGDGVIDVTDVMRVAARFGRPC